jgi:dipeptidyl aminopeptidase/acylaminoacyl peptidase
MIDTVPFGSWPSPVTPELLVSDAAVLTETWEEGDTVWWSEMRPDEAGRIQIVRRDGDGHTHDLLSGDHSARTRVHEYGGGSWWVHHGTVYFANWADQRLYRLDQDGQAVALTPEPKVEHGWRYADGSVTPDGTWIICVREDHHGDGEAANELVAIPAAGGEATVLATGRDFVSSPRISPDGRQLAWITWDHPNMPWDDTELWLAHVVTDPGSIRLEGVHRIAGTPGESVQQPGWGRHSTLYVVSDRTDWWNVYRVDGVDALTPLAELNAEVAPPPWLFGRPSYGFTRPAGDLIMTWSEQGRARLGRVPEGGGPLQAWLLPYVSLQSVRVAGERVVAIAGSNDREPEIVRFSTHGNHATQETLRPARRLDLAPGMISRAEPIEFDAGDGRRSHAFYYPPTHTDIEADDSERPPLLVLSHGGPTGAASAAFNLGIQFWTSRGFAVVDVNYGGSTGYGRAYRKTLAGRWGIVDVEDCTAAAMHLVAAGLADGERLAIRGGSAGGFTTLAALAFTDVFKAGANSFGVSDLASLAEETHKFESRYLDGLVGPWPEAKDLYAARSPINNTAGFMCPLITFQGLEDAVVPPSQSERIVAALDEKGIPHAYLAFAGEQHGFRQAETIVTVLNAELSFYAQVFGFTPAGEVPPLQLRHAEALGPR